MAKKVSDINISVNVDSSEASNEVKRFEKDMKSLDKQLARTDRSTERLENQQKHLQELYKSGKVTTQQYEQQQAKLTARMIKEEKAFDKAADAVKRYNKEQTKLSKLGKFVGGGLSGGMTKGLAAGAGIGYAATRMVSSFQESYAQALRDAGTAEMLGVLPKELASMKFALSQLTGFDGETVADQLLDIKERLGEIAGDAGGALGKAGEAINLQAEKLIGLNMSDQLAGVVKSLSEIADEETRLFRARELFGDEAARMLTTAVKDQASLNALIAEGNEMKLTMTKQELEIARQANKEFSKAKLEIAAVGRQLSSILAPLLARAVAAVRNAGEKPPAWMVAAFTGFDTAGKGNYPDKVQKDLNRKIAGNKSGLSNKLLRGVPMSERPAVPSPLGAGYYGRKFTAGIYGGMGTPVGPDFDSNTGAGAGPQIPSWLLSKRNAASQAETDAYKAFATSIQDAKEKARAGVVEGGQAEMNNFRKMQAQARENANTSAASSFSAGSVAEFEFRRDRELQADKIAADKKLAAEEREFMAGLNQRIIEKLDEIGGEDPLGGDDFGGVN